MLSQTRPPAVTTPPFPCDMGRPRPALAPSRPRLSPKSLKTSHLSPIAMSQRPPAPPPPASSPAPAPGMFPHAVQVRVSAELHEGLQQLRIERSVNVSAWLRAIIARALEAELPAAPARPRDGRRGC